MTVPRERWLIVIDTCVVRSAGESEHPVSSACRRVLKAVLDICHHVVVPRDLSDEWRKHMSRYASQWRGAMTARKKTRYSHESPGLSCLAMSAGALTNGELQAAEKDLFLLEAAASTDQVIISTDDVARSIFANLSHRDDSMRDVLWVHPVEGEAELMDMLRECDRTKCKRWRLFP